VHAGNSAPAGEKKATIPGRETDGEETEDFNSFNAGKNIQTPV